MTTFESTLVFALAIDDLAPVSVTAIGIIVNVQPSPSSIRLPMEVEYPLRSPIWRFLL